MLDLLALDRSVDYCSKMLLARLSPLETASGLLCHLVSSPSSSLVWESHSALEFSVGALDLYINIFKYIFGLYLEDLKEDIYAYSLDWGPIIEDESIASSVTVFREEFL